MTAGCIRPAADMSGFSTWRRRLPSSLAFTAYPFVQMLWMSLHNWSLIEPPRNGSASPTIVKAWQRPPVLDLARLHPEVHALHHADPDGRRLPDRAPGRPKHPSPPLHARRRLRAGRHRPRGVEPALVLAVQLRFRPGEPHRSSTSASSASRCVWFGENADRSLWAVIASIVWKVVGFGMLLFVAAIQAIPGEINEAAMVDGASYWQRSADHTAAHGAHHPARDALQRHRIAARLRPVLS